MKLARIFAVLVLFFAVDEVGAAFLGVELEPGYYAGQPAVAAHTVAPRSPADIAGFQPGDIILQVERQPITRPEEVVSLVRAARGGSRIEVEVLRVGKHVPLTVTLADSPGAPLSSGAPGAGGAADAVQARNLGLPSGGVAFTLKQSSHCSALAPADWNFQSNPQASTAEALSSDHRIYAGWGVTAINRAQEPYYGPLFGAPETSIRFLAEQVAQQMLGDASNLQYAAAPSRSSVTLRCTGSSQRAPKAMYSSTSILAPAARKTI